MCRSPSVVMMPCQEQFSSHLGSHRSSIPSRGCRRSSECFSKLIFFSLEWIMSISCPGHRKKGSCRSVQGVRGGEGVGLRAPARPHRPPCVQRLHPGALQPWEKKEKKEERKEMDDELVEEQSRDICVLKSFWNLQLSVFWKTHLVAPSYHEFSISLLPFWTVSQDFCAQGESNVAVSDTTEQKTNIFAAVNKPTSFFKKLFCF